MQFYFEIITCDPLMYTMDLPKFIVSIQKKGFGVMAVQFRLLSGPVVLPFMRVLHSSYSYFTFIYVIFIFCYFSERIAHLEKVKSINECMCTANLLD